MPENVKFIIIISIIKSLKIKFSYAYKSLIRVWNYSFILTDIEF